MTGTVPVKPPPAQDCLIDSRIRVTSGLFNPEDARWTEEPLEPGMKLILVQEGRLRSCIGSRKATEINRPTLCLIRSPGAFSSLQSYDPSIPIRYLCLYLGEQSLDEAGSVLPHASIFRRACDPEMLTLPVSSQISTLGEAIISCEGNGPLHKLRLMARTLDFVAQISETMHGCAQRDAPPITALERARLMEVRDLLVADRDRPSLSALAAYAGMNIHKLTDLFRREFGMSICTYTRQHKMNEALRLIRARQMPISCIAYHLGYSPAHFSTAFREHFGVSPRQAKGSGLVAPLPLKGGPHLR